jgi:cellulose synthase/poly-beta-1,6-N-acetylglucosamine synthase-like glycosyltransferase/phosphoglycerol transferase MdoB-like AlkP superfamily enzyme
MSAWEVISAILTYGILGYSILLLLFYIFIGLVSVAETRRYLHKNGFTDYRLIASSIQTPSISILAPAYNEGATIIENVKSLLSIFYSNLEVIIINDGSKDDTLQKLIDAYQLEKVDFFVQYKIKSKEVRGVYKSKNSVYKKLVVVDKVNGGKADALNVGINISSNDYILCIDVDCILEQDAILKMVKPFLEETGSRVIAAGGVVRIANSCVIEDGRLVKVRLPKEYLPRMQTLEYIRAFLLGRMAWARINGLLLISGAFGAFDKDIVIRCGGYDHSTVGEDMELVVRMRRYMEENKLPYKVKYIPDPLCWTEAPNSYEILGRQRNRWTRGTIETMWLHKKMFLNPSYGLLGMLSYPYWFLYEMLAPVVEFFGMIALFFFAWFGLIAWQMFFHLLIFIICFGYVYSAFAVFMEVASYHQYKRRSDVARLLLTALTEPFMFHPFVVWSAVKGYWDLFRKNKSWGEMTRQGFAQPAAAVAAAQAMTAPSATLQASQVAQTNDPVPAIEKATFKNRIAALHPLAFIKKTLLSSIPVFCSYFIITAVIFFLLRAIEIISSIIKHGMPADFWSVVGFGILKDQSFLLSTALWLLLVFIVLYALNKKVAKIILIAGLTVLAVVQLLLGEYFVTTLNPLGADLWIYTWTDIKQTVGASGGLNLTTILLSVAAIVALLSLYIFIPRFLKVKLPYALLLVFIFLVAAATNVGVKANQLSAGNEYTNNLSLNKSQYFYAGSYEHFNPANTETDIYKSNFAKSAFGGFTYVDEKNYPFLHSDTAADVLSPFFQPAVIKPNIVFIVVEGLGRAFTNEGAYLGNFTPYLDSLSKKSLYWPDFLSNGGRTFAVLPSLLASLPFGNTGFAELNDKMPDHLSLLNILKHNGYKTSFYYAGNSSFDFMNNFVKKNNVDHVFDENNFPQGYRKMPSVQDFSWGYGDKELYRFLLAKQLVSDTPYLNVVLTVATHNPFIINEQQTYLDRFEKRMTALKFDQDKKRQSRFYKNQFATILYADDAMRELMKNYSKREDFNNTIFVITGDHRMPEIPMSDKLDRYHVPLLIYSPLLKRAETFNVIGSHDDVTPSLLSFLKNSSGVELPKFTAWVGAGLDTARNFSNTHAYPLKQTKPELVDYVEGVFMLNGNDLYQVSPEMELSRENDEQRKSAMKAHFNEFKLKNQKIATGGKIIPDSIYKRFNR